MPPIPRNSECPRVNAASPLPAPFRLPCLCRTTVAKPGARDKPELLPLLPGPRPTPSQLPNAVDPTSRCGTPVPRQPGQQRPALSLLTGLPVGLTASGSSSRTGRVHSCDLPSPHRRLPKASALAMCLPHPRRASALAASSGPKAFPLNLQLKGHPPPAVPVALPQVLTAKLRAPPHPLLCWGHSCICPCHGGGSWDGGSAPSWWALRGPVSSPPTARAEAVPAAWGFRDTVLPGHHVMCPPFKNDGCTDPWPGGWSVDHTPEGCRFDPQSGRIQEAIDRCFPHLCFSLSNQ